VNAKDPKQAAKLVRDMQKRDRRDSTRATSPLIAAPDAIHVDTSKLNIEEVIAEIEKIVSARLNASKTTAS